MALYLEERLMLRLADFLGFGKSMIDPAALPDESDYEAQRVVAKVLATNAIRYYFGNMQIVPSQVELISQITLSAFANCILFFGTCRSV
jgi:vacuolar protein sorting-associated protein 13D